eukprot:COSAG01_NODE_69622_length_261_cov_0.382716_1_plen_31_part_10
MSNSCSLLNRAPVVLDHKLVAGAAKLTSLGS